MILSYDPIDHDDIEFDDEDDFDAFSFLDEDDYDDDDYESLWDEWMGDEVDPRELYYTHDFDRDDEWWVDE